MLKSKLVLPISIFCWLTPIAAFAIGGPGATCNPSTSNWGSCALAPVPFQDSVSNTVNIPAGNYNSPFIASQSNTRYVLQGNITASGTAISLKANYVIIDLNGYTITYNQSSPGEGVVVGDWNLHHISVRNGSIIQGAAKSEGDLYGRGNSPVSAYNSSDTTKYEAHNFHVANLYVRYGGRDMGGIVCSGNNGLYEQNTIEDTYQFGTLKNRHQGNDALIGGKDLTSASGNVYRYNTLVNIRHRGIDTGNDAQAYGNRIGLRSIATNSGGISHWEGHDIKVYSNTIIGRGEHPIGISFSSIGTNNIEVYDNDIDVMTTALGDEYGGDATCFDPSTPCGNFAVGFRTTWGADNLNFHDNKINIATDSSYSGTYSPTGASVKVNAKGRGLMVAINSGETATFANNIITVLDKDGTGKAFGMACTGENNSDKMFFLNNTVTSNIANMVLGDEYGACNGYPLIKGNTFVKSGNFSAYKTISSQLGGYQNATGRIIDNNYSGGASVDSINLNPSGDGLVDVYFGSVINSSYRYSHRLHDNSGSSSTLLRQDFTPTITMSFAIPAAQTPSTIPSPQGLSISQP